MPQHRQLRIFIRAAMQLGALPARPVRWALVAAFTAWVIVDVFILKFSGGLAQSTYDAMVRGRMYAAAPDPRIVIIDIDEASLARMSKEFGRWPWPRDTLAAVLDHVEKQKPSAVVWDIVFSDADRFSPGGDAAFNAAVQRSAHSHFSVVRLPEKNDSSSQITRKELPGLWLPGTPLNRAGEKSTVALIAPALPAIAAGRMGYINGYADRDGVLRRFRYAESLADGSAIQSLPLSVSDAVNSASRRIRTEGITSVFAPVNELLVWRKSANTYPLVSFADVFAQADGAAPLGSVPNFAGKVVIIGTTAPSLHDMHATPLSPTQAGVDSLATAIDNSLNGHHMAELPRWLQALLAVLLCMGIARWGRVYSVASLAPALLLLPAALLGISYLSLNGLPLFIDLNLAAGLSLIFLAALRVWNYWRRQYWSNLSLEDSSTDKLNRPKQGLWVWHRHDLWQASALDSLIDAIEIHAPHCRLITPDVNFSWPATPHWPELAGLIAITGPYAELVAARKALTRAIRKIDKLGDVRHAALKALPADTSRAELCANALVDWATLAQLQAESQTKSRLPCTNPAAGSATLLKGTDL